MTVYPIIMTELLTKTYTWINNITYKIKKHQFSSKTNESPTSKAIG